MRRHTTKPPLPPLAFIEPLDVGAHDQTGWPIVPGARVRVDEPFTLSRACECSGGGNCERCGGTGSRNVRPTRHGVVRRSILYRGRPVVEVVEIDSLNVLTPGPEHVRVMRGETRKSRELRAQLEATRSKRQRNRGAGK